MEEITNIIKKSKFSKNELKNIISLCENNIKCFINEEVKEHLIKKYNSNEKIIKNITDIKVNYNVSNYHMDSVICCSIDKFIFSRQYYGTTDGEGKYEYYITDSSNETIYSFGDEERYSLEPFEIEKNDFENDGWKKITKLTKKYKISLKNFVELFFEILDYIEEDRKIQHIFNV